MDEKLRNELTELLDGWSNVCVQELLDVVGRKLHLAELKTRLDELQKAMVHGGIWRCERSAYLEDQITKEQAKDGR